MDRPRDRVTVLEGASDAKGLRFAVVVSRFNSHVTEPLLDGAVDTLLRAGADPEDVTVLRVPGSWELPGASARAVETGRFDAVVALGCLIRGDTIHFDLIAAETAKGLATIERDAGIPVGFGVLTTDTLEQAIDRAGAKLGNKGAEAAAAAVEQARLYQSLETLGAPSANAGAKKARKGSKKSPGRGRRK